VKRFLSLVLLLSSATSVAGATARHALVPPSIFAKVLRVHHCEEPTWNVSGPYYAGGLGWRLATWSTYRFPWMPTSASNATPQEQARAMLRFVTVAEHGWWPDQHGCTGGY